MDLIVEMRFGSHLYGTATPQSDLDYKAVYIPAAQDILLQRVQDTLTFSSNKAPGEKNAPGDVDREAYSLQRFLTLLAEGQTVALDMLFAPDWAMTSAPTPLWRTIQSNAPRLITRRASGFMRYCRHQADKFGLKGARVAVARRFLSLLGEAEAKYGTVAKLAVAAVEIDRAIDQSAHAALVDLPLPNGGFIRHLEVCGKKLAFTSSIKSARETVERLVNEYGERALQAELNEGIDWKALSHAVRVGREAIELFETGTIRFPLACAAELLAIKNGEQEYRVVSETIDRVLLQAEAAAAASDLRDAPDQDFIDQLVTDAYRAKIALI